MREREADVLSMRHKRTICRPAIRTAAPLFAAVLLLFAGLPARAFDIAFINPGFLHAERDGVVQPPTPIGGGYVYRASQQTLTGLFSVGLRDLDVEAIQIATVAVELVAVDAANQEQDRLRIAELQETVKVGIPFPSNRYAPLSGNGISEWFARQRAQGFAIQVHLIADPDNAFKESDETNNTVVVAGLDLQTIPLSDTMDFGGIATQIVNLTADSDAACNTSTEVWVFNADVLLDNDPSGNWDPLQMALLGVPICTALAFDPGSSLFDLATTSIALGGPVAGQSGGLTASIASVAVAGTLGKIAISELTVDLPPRHSYHDSDGSGRPLPRGRRQVKGVGAGQLLDSLDDMLVVLPAGHLQVAGLPFDIAVNNFSFAGTSFSLGGDGLVRYAHDQAYDIWDARNEAKDGVTSNDRRFSVEDTHTVNFTVDAAGLDTNLAFLASPAGKPAPTHFPRTRQSWSDFGVTVQDGSLLPGLLPAEAYRFTQRTACAECPADGGPGRQFQLLPGGGAGPQGIAADGAVLARFASIGTNAAWGPHDPVPDRFIFERLDDQNRPGIIYLPGFMVPGSGGDAGPGGAPDPVVPTLLGMRRANPLFGSTYMPGTLYRQGQLQARRGNYFMAGLTVGPEVYYGPDVNNPVQPGAGSDLAGSTMRIGFGGLNNPDYRNVVNNPGAKYVVRPGGVTGVFNTDTPPQPVIYGYHFSLDRFAFRLVGSVLDEFTWIDGLVAVPAPGDFDVVFESLQIACTGDIGQGLVVREACDGIDNNGNGHIDEGCEQLGAWQADFRVLTMEFKPDNPAAPFCAAGDRNLWVGSTVDLVALRDLIGLYSGWQADGKPLPGANVTGGTEQVLDEPTGGDAPGFPVALGSQVDLALRDNQAEGWFRFHDSAVELPFWDTLQAGLRLQNLSPEARRQSIILEESSDANHPLNRTNIGNADIIQRNVSNLDSVYTWGATGFGISLPIYYDSGPTPRFLGNKLSYNLLVLDANANTDFITPGETKVSFGASADLNSVNIGGVPISLNPNDPSSFLQLATYGIGAAVEVAMTELADKVNGMNGAGGNNLDGFIESGFRDALAGMSQQPFDSLANGLGRAGGVPGELLSQMVVGINERIGTALRPLTDDASVRLDKLVADLPPILAKAGNGGVLTPAELAVLQEQQQSLDTLQAAAAQVSGGLQAVTGEIQQVRDDILGPGGIGGLLDEIGDLATELEAARGALYDGLDTVLTLTSCNPAKNPILGKVNEVKQRVDDVREALEQIPLDEIGSAFSSVSNVDLSEVSQAKQQIQDLASDIADRITEARNAVTNALGCGGGGPLENFATQVEQFLGAAGDLFTAVQNMAGELDTALTALLGTNPTDGKLGSLLAVVNDVRGVAAAFDQDLQTLQQDLALAIDYATGGGAAPHYAIANDGIAPFDTLIADWFADNLKPGGVNVVEQLRGPEVAGMNLALDDITLTAITALSTTLSAFPNATGADVQAHVTDLFMNNGAINQADQIFATNYLSLMERTNGIQSIVFDQVNHLLQELILAAGGALADAINNSNDSVGSGGDDWNMPTFKMDGYALIAGDDLQQVHVGLELGVPGAEEQDSFGFGASLDITRWTANGKDQGCQNVDAASRLDVVIAAYDLPIFLGTSKATLQKAYLGFTLDESGGPLLPVQVFGGVLIVGNILLGPVRVFDPGVVFGGGDVENYIGARVGASFDATTIQVAFLVGKICNNDPLLALDPQAAEFIQFPGGGGFTGGYVRGSASTTIINYGCPLQLGAGADVGNWLFIADGNQPTVFGGIVGGGVFGTAACIVSIRGQITIIMSIAFPELTMAGETFFVGGLGFCSPSTWTTIPRSRDDDIFCGTVDARLGASATVDLDSLFNGGGSGAIDFQIDPPEFGAIH